MGAGAHRRVERAGLAGGPGATVDMVLFVVANGLLATNLVLLLVGSGRTLYDRAVGTVVRRRPGSPSTPGP